MFTQRVKAAASVRVYKDATSIHFIIYIYVTWYVHAVLPISHSVDRSQI